LENTLDEGQITHLKTPTSYYE